MIKKNHFSRTRENQYIGNINSIIVEPLVKGGLDDFQVKCITSIIFILINLYITNT